MVMASTGVDGGGDASQECRMMRRRRRHHSPCRVRHVAASDEAGSRSGAAEKRSRPLQSASPSSSSACSDAASSDGEEDEVEMDDDEEVVEEEEGSAAAAAGSEAAHVLPAPPPPQPLPLPQVWPLAFGSVSLAGRMREMEDAVSLRPSFCRWSDGSPMHFFAVFDGHGGPHVSALCREQMHVILAEELAAVAVEGEDDEEAAWRVALTRSFARVDELSPMACACGRATVPACRCPLSGQTGAIIGSTAVVALLVRDRLVVANCGDSRAILCRARAPLPLSDDHKPDRPDERARIEAVGGRVVYLNGPRVRGILAMSRALGDRFLKPEVICEPEITITKRTVEDDCIILASDGMWDVISNETASDVARQCLEDGNPSINIAAGSSEAASSSITNVPAAVRQVSEPRCYRTAALLARLALGRDSSDNISVVVIDLKRRV